MCGEGCRTYLGRSAWCPEIGTEAIVRFPDRHAEVSRGHSTRRRRGRPERSPSIRGVNGVVGSPWDSLRRTRDSWAQSGRKSSWNWPLWQRVGVKPRWLRIKGPKRPRRSVNPKTQRYLFCWQNREQLNQPNRRGTDPYARWCDRESPRGHTYVDCIGSSKKIQHSAFD